MPAGTPGLPARSAAFEAVATAVADMVGATAAAEGATVVRFPPVVDRSVVVRSGYVGAFPDLLGVVRTFRGGDRDHARVLADLEGGQEWEGAFGPSGVALCPAACHPLYPLLRSPLPAGGACFDVLGWVFRSEPSDDPARLQAFRQHEVVHVGDEAGADRHADTWVAHAGELLEGLGLRVRAVEATDPFFGRAGRLLAAGQRQRHAKVELVGATGPDRPDTALASVNRHGDHFGLAFGLLDAAGAPASSACVGFGLERIVLALAAAHGPEPDRWPLPVRDALRGDGHRP